MVSRHWHEEALQRMQQRATPQAMRLRCSLGKLRVREPLISTYDRGLVRKLLLSVAKTSNRGKRDYHERFQSPVMKSN